MPAEILDGKAIAKQIQAETKQKVADFIVWRRTATKAGRCIGGRGSSESGLRSQQGTSL